MRVQRVPCGAVWCRISAPVRDLPFDGLFSQLGEVFFKIRNMNTTHNLSVVLHHTFSKWCQKNVN